MTPHTTTELTSPHDLLAAVPFMVGYHPKDSLVAMALRDHKVVMAMRVDLPDQQMMEATSRIIASHLLREEASEAIVVGYLSATESSLDPLATLREVITAQGVAIKECIEVRGGHFRSMLCEDVECCPPEGTPVPPLSDSRVTVEQVAAGNPLPYLDLDEMKRSIAALPADKDLSKAIKKIAEIDYESDGVVILQREGADAINQLAAQFKKDGFSKDKALQALVLVRLLDLQVRDYAMGMATDESADLLWDMWRWLLRVAPRGYVAGVAVIFATASYERGDGALAQRALDRAFDDNPSYQMAKLLRRTFAAGWPPSAFTQMRADLHPKICAAIYG
jgi:Domain of unknown function (DUF4192)